MTHISKIALFTGAVLLGTIGNSYAEPPKSFPGITFVSRTAPEVAISLHDGAWHIYLNGDYSKDAAKIEAEDTKVMREAGEPGLPLLVTRLEQADKFGLPENFALQRTLLGKIICDSCKEPRRLWELHKAQ